MEDLADLLAQHCHIYDSDCSDDYGCSCGWESVSSLAGHYHGVDHAAHNLHLAEILTQEGYAK